MRLIALASTGCFPHVNVLVGKEALVCATSRNVQDIDEALNLVSNHYVTRSTDLRTEQLREIILS